MLKEQLDAVKNFKNTDFSDCPILTDKQLAQMQPCHIVTMNKITEKGIINCIEKFVKVLNPKKIYLFGSYARGDYNKNSDYDFYIIMDDTTELTGEESIQAKMALFGTDYKRPVDILVNTESKFKKNTVNPAFVEYDVNKEGVVVYER